MSMCGRTIREGRLRMKDWEWKTRKKENTRELDGGLFTLLQKADQW